MKATKETLTNNQIFALRVRADDKGLRQLVKTIDRYLEFRSDEDLETVAMALGSMLGCLVGSWAGTRLAAGLPVWPW